MLLFIHVLCSQVESYEIFLMLIKSLMLKDGLHGFRDLGTGQSSLIFQFCGLPVSVFIFLQGQVVSCHLERQMADQLNTLTNEVTLEWSWPTLKRTDNRFVFFFMYFKSI